VLVLALGIGVNTAMFSLVNALVLQPRVGRIDQLVGVFSRDRTKADSYRDFSYPAYVDIRDRGDVFESVMAHSFSTVGIREGDLTKQTFASVVSSNYFATLGVRLAAGRAFTPAEERPGARAPVAIASYTAWHAKGLDPAFVGSTVRMNGIDVVVVGVAPRGFAGTMTIVSPQWWLPLGMYDVIVNEMFKARATSLSDRQNYALNLVGALKPGVTRAVAEQALDGFAKRLDAEYPGSDHDRTFVLAGVPRMSVSSSPKTDGPLGAVSALLMLMAALVLAVACLNLANLLLARGASRRKEIAIRQALGSGRARIIRQLLVEGLTLSSIGAVFGIVAGWWTTGALSAWLGGQLTFGIDIVVEPSPRLLVAAAGFAVLSTLFFALGPAWSLSRADVAGDMNLQSARVTGSGRMGSVLVVGQLAVSLALVVSGGLFVRGAAAAASTDPGFSLERQLVIGLDPSLAGYNQARTRATYRAVLERVRGLAGVERASFASTVPFGEITDDRTVRTSPAEKGIRALFDVIGAEYFETLGLRVPYGREFTRAEEEAGPGPRVAMIDSRLAKQLFGDADPLGRTIQVQQREADDPEAFTVVGVAPEVRHDLFEVAAEPHAFVAYGSKFNTMMTLHVRTASGVPETALLTTIRGELQRLDSQLPILSARTMTIHRDKSIAAWSVRAAATLFTVFGALALLLATIGVYGLKAYDVTRRTREIGIRMALGATTGDVERLMLREGGRTTIVGLAIGLALALGAGKLVSGLLFRVSPFDPIVLTVSAAVLCAATMLACYLPARRATRIVPLDALRAE
jgi:predicted permease